MLVQLLLVHGADADMNAKDDIGLTPLQVAAKRGYTKFMRILLANGAFDYAEASTDRADDAFEDITEENGRYE